MAVDVSRLILRRSAPGEERNDECGHDDRANVGNGASPHESASFTFVEYLNERHEPRGERVRRRSEVFSRKRRSGRNTSSRCCGEDCGMAGLLSISVEGCCVSCRCGANCNTGQAVMSRRSYG